MTALEQAVGGERFAPRHLLQQLKQVDRDAELVYIGDGAWWVGTFRPNLKNRATGSHKVKVAQDMADVAEARRMERVGRLQQAGFVYLKEYVVQGVPDGRIARDFEYADWMNRMVVNTEHRFMAHMAAEKEQTKQASRDDLADPYRAQDAWKYAFTQSHAVTRIDATDKKSGRKTFNAKTGVWS